MTLAIVIGVALLGLLVIAGLYTSRAMQKADEKKPKPDGSGADGPDGDSGGGDGDS